MGIQTELNTGKHKLMPTFIKMAYLSLIVYYACVEHDRESLQWKAVYIQHTDWRTRLFEFKAARTLVGEDTG